MVIQISKKLQCREKNLSVALKIKTDILLICRPSLKVVVFSSLTKLFCCHMHLKTTTPPPIWGIQFSLKTNVYCFSMFSQPLTLKSYLYNLNHINYLKNKCMKIRNLIRKLLSTI